MCRRVLTIVEEDEMKLFLPMMFESVHMGCEWETSEDVILAPIKSGYVLGASCERRTI